MNQYHIVRNRVSHVLLCKSLTHSNYQLGFLTIIDIFDNNFCYNSQVSCKAVALDRPRSKGWGPGEHRGTEGRTFPYATPYFKSAYNYKLLLMRKV